MKLEFTTSPVVADWVARRVEGLENRDDFGPSSCLGIGRNGVAVAGVVYSMYRKEKYGSSVWLTIAAKQGVPWAQPEVLRQIFHYPFVELGCTRVGALIKEGNTKSIKLCTRVGFRKEGVLRRGWDGKSNALVYGLLRHECGYLNHG